MAGVEAGQAYIPVRPDMSGFGREVESGTSGALSSIKSFAKTAAIALGGAFAVTKGLDFLKGAVGAASDLNETVSKSRSIFGPASAGLEKWASGAAAAFGQSKQQALDAAGTFGNLFVQLGVGADQAAGMSTQMVQLASDFASFHNANPQDVIDAQTAAFRGEYDALQRYVPTINAAAVEQEALKETGKKTTKELTLQEKALATQTLMMQGAGDAAGDFARTSDGLANKQRIFSARMDDLKAKIGQGLLPVMSAVTGFMSDHMIPAFDAIGRFAGQVFGILFKGDFKGGGPFAEDSKFVDTLFNIREAITNIIDQAKLFWNALTTGFTEDEGTPIEMFALTLREKVLPVIQDITGFVTRNLQPILIGLGIAVALLAAPFLTLAAAAAFLYFKFDAVRAVVDAVVGFFMNVVVPAVATVAAGIVEQFSALVGWAQLHWAAIQEAIDHVLRVIREIVGVFIDVISAAWRAWGDDLLHIAQAAWDYISTSVKLAVDLVRNIIDTVLALINGDWGKAWDGIKGILGDVWSQIQNILKFALGVVQGVIGGALSAISEVWSGIWDKLKGIVGGAMDGVVAFVSGLPGRILEFAGAILLAGAGLGGAFLDGLKKGLTAAAGFAGDLAAGIVRVVKDGWNAVADLINDFVPDSIGWGPFKLDIPDNPIPKFHDGGVFRAATPGGEGLALLRDREVITTPGDLDAVVVELRGVRNDLRRLEDAQVRLARTS